tara:strand:+ start:92 stop:439 length:348 start_codon:yes stop_codon:yes gene_type:complete
MDNIFIKEIDNNTLLINSTEEISYPLDSLNYITLLEKYDLIKYNEEKLVKTNLELNKTINNLRTINYNSHIKNELLTKKLNNNNLIIKNLELDIIEMNKELNEYENIFKNFNIIE